MKIRIHRDSHGHWWMEEEDIRKLAPNLESDSSIVLTVIVEAKET